MATVTPPPIPTGQAARAEARPQAALAPTRKPNALPMLIARGKVAFDTATPEELIGKAIKLVALVGLFVGQVLVPLAGSMQDYNRRWLAIASWAVFLGGDYYAKQDDPDAGPKVFGLALWIYAGFLIVNWFSVADTLSDLHRTQLAAYIGGVAVYGLSLRLYSYEKLSKPLLAMALIWAGMAVVYTLCAPGEWSRPEQEMGWLSVFWLSVFVLVVSGCVILGDDGPSMPMGWPTKPNPTVATSRWAQPYESSARSITEDGEP